MTHWPQGKEATEKKGSLELRKREERLKEEKEGEKFVCATVYLLTAPLT